MLKAKDIKLISGKTFGLTHILYDRIFWLPNVNFLVANHLASLEDKLLCGIELCHEALSGIAGRVC